MCNGEITNYLKLITEMGLRPKDLRTNSDTEVILKLYDRYGSKIFEKLNTLPLK